MNYLEYYGLQQEPFSNTPASKFYYNSAQHSSVLLRIMHVVEGMRGLGLVLGDVGMGKTTLARKLLEQLSPETYQAALIVVVHSSIDPAWFLKKIARQLGIEQASDDKVELLGQVQQELQNLQAAGRRTVVLIDEAQMLASREILEEMRGLLNIEVNEQKLITFVLFGLDELDEVLELDPPLKQRTAMKVHLENLSRDGTGHYVRHRLRLAGAGRPLFDDAAIAAVHLYTRGTPRLINVLCDNALLEGFLMSREAIDRELIEACATDLGLRAGAEATEPTAAPAPAPVPVAEPGFDTDMAPAPELESAAEPAAEIAGQEWADDDFDLDADEELEGAVAAVSEAAAEDDEPEVEAEAEPEPEPAAADEGGDDDLEAFIAEMESAEGEPGDAFELGEADSEADDNAGLIDEALDLSVEDDEGTDVDAGEPLDVATSDFDLDADTGLDDLDDENDLDAALDAFAAAEAEVAEAASEPEIDFDPEPEPEPAMAVAEDGGDDDLDALMADLEGGEAPDAPAAESNDDIDDLLAGLEDDGEASAVADEVADDDVDALLSELDASDAGAAGGDSDDDIDALLNQLDDADSEPEAPASKRKDQSGGGDADLDDLLSQIDELQDA